MNRAACKHSNEAPSYTVSILGSNKSIPLVETHCFGSPSIGIQNDTGCQLSLISKSALQVLPTDMYSIKKPTRVRILAYAGEEETILTTKVQLKLSSCTLQLYVVADTLNITFFLFFNFTAKPVEGMHREWEIIPFWQDLYPPGGRQLPCFSQGNRPRLFWACSFQQQTY